MNQPDTAAAAWSAVGQVVALIQDLGGGPGGVPAAGRTPAADAAPGAAASPDAGPAGASPRTQLANREITIQLNPETLGTVQVRMRMRADTIDIRIEVANPQTLRALDKDRHLLSAAVEALGAGPKALALTGPETPAAAAARADPQDAFAFAGSPGREGRPASQRAASPTRTHATRNASDVSPDPRPGRADSSLYL